MEYVAIIYVISVIGVTISFFSEVFISSMKENRKIT